jgi:HSP20 family protein
MVNSLISRPTMPASPVGEMDTIFNRLIRGDGPWAWEGALLTWPRMDVCETEDGYLLEMDLPGVARDDVQVEVTGDELVITGERKRQESGDKYYLRVERDFGQFQRRIRLTIPVEQDQIEASYQNGVLRITVPKAAHAKPRKVPVKS